MALFRNDGIGCSSRGLGLLGVGLNNDRDMQHYVENGLADQVECFEQYTNLVTQKKKKKNATLEEYKIYKFLLP